MIHVGSTAISSASIAQVMQIADNRPVGADPAAKTRNTHKIEQSKRIETAKTKQVLSIPLNAKYRLTPANVSRCMIFIPI
jgi:hypothetical protein